MSIQYRCDCAGCFQEARVFLCERSPNAEVLRAVADLCVNHFDQIVKFIGQGQDLASHTTSTAIVTPRAITAIPDAFSIDGSHPPLGSKDGSASPA